MSARLRYDSGLAHVVARRGAAVVLMHNRGRSREMYREAGYVDVAREVAGELRERLAFAEAAGIERERILVDPGIGFAKRAEHSLALLAGLRELETLDRPVLVGPSRKSFLKAAIGERNADQRDWGTAAAVTTAVLLGAHVVRVHAVAEMVDVVRTADAIRRRGVRPRPLTRTHRVLCAPDAPDAPDAPNVDLSWISEALGRPSLGWRDVIDIALVSLLIYEVLVLIRGTRAVQMAVGAGLAVALFYLSKILQLETVNWLIRNMVGYVVFAAIVLFQSDIRRALAHLGRAPFFRYLAKGETVDETVEEIAVAAQMLSSQRTGAIVVVERQIGLRNYSEGGIPLDAQISYDLLVTIFQVGSPLHDGAVIIQENRISAAACFLPLTVNPRLSKDLGTRHRAAIGLTEENDALAVVVSEETGWISLVLDGRVERNITPEHLRVRLRELLRPRRFAEGAVPARRAAL